MRQAFHAITVSTKGPGLYEFSDDAAAFVRAEKIANESLRYLEARIAELPS